MDKIIIGLSGRKGSGKNLFGELIKEIEPSTELFALADPIKEIGINYFGLDREICYGDNDIKNRCETNWNWNDIPSNQDKRSPQQTKNKKYGPMTYREILQWIGTEIFRENMHTDFWVKLCLDRISKSSAKINIVTDVRFLNEVQLIKNQGGTLVRLKNQNLPNNDKHPSESSLDEIDRNISVEQAVCETEDPEETTGCYKINGIFDYFIYNNIMDREVLKYTAEKFLEDLEIRSQ